MPVRESAIRWGTTVTTVPEAGAAAIFACAELPKATIDIAPNNNANEDSTTHIRLEVDILENDILKIDRVVPF